MKWYWHRAGGHTHVRVFMNGGKCGDLCFRNAEFDEIVDLVSQHGNPVAMIEFISDDPEPEPDANMSDGNPADYGDRG